MGPKSMFWSVKRFGLLLLGHPSIVSGGRVEDQSINLGVDKLSTIYLKRKFFVDKSSIR
jgi:hypothetical protein